MTPPANEALAADVMAMATKCDVIERVKRAEKIAATLTGLLAAADALAEAVIEEEQARAEYVTEVGNDDPDGHDRLITFIDNFASKKAKKAAALEAYQEARDGK